MVTPRKTPQHLAPKRKSTLPLAAVIIAVLLCGGIGFAAAQGLLPDTQAAQSSSANSSTAESSAAKESSDASSVEEAAYEQQAQSEAQLDASQQSSAEAASSEQAPSEQASSEQSASSEASSSVEETVKPSTTPANSELAWRDTDFAVDPERPAGSTSDNGRKVVYITIDADPSSYHYIKEAYDRGHTIGLHTMTHDYAYVYSSTDAYYADLNEIGQVVKDQIGYVPCFMRFPGGSSNGVSADYCAGIMSELVNSVQAQGYQYYDWNVSTGDGAVHTADELVGYVKEFEPETNIVLLCHDSETKQSTVEALPQIIEYYQGLGYSFEAIDRNTWVPHHGVAN